MHIEEIIWVKIGWQQTQKINKRCYSQLDDADLKTIQGCLMTSQEEVVKQAQG